MTTTRTQVYDEKVLRSNIEEVLDQATSSIYKEAREWYPKAHGYAVDFGIKYEKPIEITSALISVLSPQKEWFHNLQLTEDFLKSKGRRVRHVQKQVDKAKAIYHIGDNYSLDDIVNIIGGPKTSNFFRNIYDPKDNNYVTIDTHMLQLLSGDFTYNKPTIKQYNFMKKVLIDVAKEQKMLSSEFQSVLWITWKSIKPRRLKEAEVENIF